MAQGLVHFPGIAQAVGADFTLSHGISPSVCVLEITPQTSFPALGGTLEFAFDNVHLKFPDCRIDKNSFSADSSGQTWRLQVFDRRWKWKFGEISGRYNLREDDDEIDPATEKAPRDLAKLCLEAMKEKGFSVADMPNDARPEIEWDRENPAEALAALCDDLGCRVVLGTDNKVHIAVTGKGRELPDTPTVSQDSLTIDPPETPDNVKIIGAPTRYQARWKLEAVGQEQDGTVKPIDELSYAPEEGWGVAEYETFADVEDKKDRQLAVQWIWKAYRIATMVDDTLDIPHHGQIDSIDQCLPIEETLADAYKDPKKKKSKKKSKPALITGVFFDRKGSGENSEAGTLYEYDFRIEKDTGIVRFSEPMLKLADDGVIEPAEIQLECAFGVRDNETRVWNRFEQVKRISRGRQFGTGDELVWHEDLVRTLIAKYNESGTEIVKVEDNEEAVKKLAKPYLDAVLERYQTPASRDRTYNGLLDISPDGAIQQVSWSVGVSGGAMTRASLNDEFVVNVPTHDERRQLERLRNNRLIRQDTARKEAVQKREAARRGT